MKKPYILWVLCVSLCYFSCKNGNVGAALVEQNSKSDTMTTRAASHIPLEDFFKNPEKTGYKISPDGKYWAFLAPYKNRKNIFVQRIGATEATRLTTVTDRDIASFFWGNNERLIYTRDTGGDENYRLFAVHRKTAEQIDLTPYDNVKVDIIDPLRKDEAHLLIAMNQRNPQLFDPYRLNIHTGEVELLAENPGQVTGWLTDHEGSLRIAIATNGVVTQILYRKKETEDFHVVCETSFKETLYPLFFDFDNGDIVYAVSNINRARNAIIRYDLAQAKELEEIYAHPEVDVSFLSYSQKEEKVTTISYTTWKRMYAFLDKETEALYERLSKALGEYELVISSADRDEQRFIIRTYSDRSLGAYYFYDRETDSLTQIATISPWLKETDLAPMKPITYTARDGLTIHGYLTLPVGVEPKNLPVVIHPHGGPWARDTWTFNPEVQFLANRGYAVLQMNFRGSTGYGRAFWEASFKEWGYKMQDDITDGVQWLIEQGIADPARLAIYGGSYGGYATLAGMTFTPDLYACGIDYVGVSNLFTFLESIPPYWEPYREMLYEMVGNPDDAADSTRMRARSPLFHIDKIKAPLFIAQGAHDPRVKQAESDQIVEALRADGVEVQYMLKENEGHGFGNEENRFEFYEAMEAFLATHLGQ